MRWNGKDLDTIKCEALKAALEHFQGNQVHAAKALKITRTTVWNMIDRCPCLSDFKPIDKREFARNINKKPRSADKAPPGHR